MNGLEIERKFLLPNNAEFDYPEIKRTKSLRGYISLSPEVRITEIYNLKSDSRDPITHRLTIKSSGHLIRDEINQDISPDIFMTLSRMMNGGFLVKMSSFYRVTDSLVIVDSSVYLKDGIYRYAEIEFETEAEAMNFKWNGYCKNISDDAVKEITSDETYKMKNIWRRECSYEIKSK